ncbi:hypothetical protein HanRHA438_Chr14g0642451 [Helianthus annuus]|uniref:Secreted protein n=1 Tax=Helianthus annuus TaxID=4232 RepID=A0A9K3E8P6_HELAN|nr:hypothetical protein HanXRQr2_Chr14g0631481 [Helianthus annuus]KAJ0467434.1 hypothetical protein HanIR_Chr14g0685201 [Helianthus annuus]KAJ0484833.1 hypothetical protein HanHA89_Chr14g0561261 [Helianthus annuus]KAJ0655384.1 hypothetical protein HanLR1_Chr14g0523571 [Helianthus annuus]KAJ0659077.1 hypothetical protein HanOQP8_Chr14g0521901 [Helianthus annuus]
MLLLFILLYCFAATSSDLDASTSTATAIAIATATDTPSFVNRCHVFRSRRLHRHRYTATDTSSEVKESVVLDLAATVFGGGCCVSGGGVSGGGCCVSGVGGERW